MDPMGFKVTPRFRDGNAGYLIIEFMCIPYTPFLLRLPLERIFFHRLNVFLTT